MTASHSSFEVLCALEASGQLSDTESAYLRDHYEQCVLCQERLAVMRRVGMQLLLAQAAKTSRKRLPKGMKERFAARAAGEGIPLRSRSSKGGFTALGVATVVLLLLSVIAITLRTKPAIETKVANGSHAAADSYKRQSSPPVKLEAKETRYPTMHRNQTANLASLQNRRFTFTPDLRITFDPTSGIIRSPLDVRSATRTFRGSLDLSAYSTPWKPNFKATGPPFQITQNLVP
jgi:hypothetical protein